MAKVEITEYVIGDVIKCADEHIETWADKTWEGWLSGLVEEVGELAESINDGDIQNMRHELTQIAAIAINFRRRIG